MLKEFWRPEVSSDPDNISDFKAYWALYGGARSIWTSPYFLIATLSVPALRPLWCGSQEWHALASDVVPSLLGFSIGAVAILLATSSMGLFSILAGSGEKDSYFLEVASKLFHFILVQVVALAALAVSKAYPNCWTSGVGFWIFSYAVLTSVAAGLALFGLARVFNFGAADDGGSAGPPP